MQTALHEQLCTAVIDQFLHFTENLRVAEHVGIRMHLVTVERAELTLGGANVGVVDIAINNKRNAPLPMHAMADSISQLTQSKQINIGQQEECLFSVQRLTSIDLFFNCSNHYQP